MNATPLDSVLNKHKGIPTKYAVVAGVLIVLAGVLGVGAYVLRAPVQSPQTTQTRAALPSCLPDNRLPLPADPDCYDGEPPLTIDANNWKSCTSPSEGFCKSKGVGCVECRDRFEGLRIICRCQLESPTPTPALSKSCPPPQVVTAVVMSCPGCQ